MSCLEHDWSEPAMIPASAQLVGTRDSELTLVCWLLLVSCCELCACFIVRERKYGLTRMLAPPGELLWTLLLLQRPRKKVRTDSRTNCAVSSSDTVLAR